MEKDIMTGLREDKVERYSVLIELISNIHFSFANMSSNYEGLLPKILKELHVLFPHIEFLETDIISFAQINTSLFAFGQKDICNHESDFAERFWAFLQVCEYLDSIYKTMVPEKTNEIFGLMYKYSFNMRFKDPLVTALYEAFVENQKIMERNVVLKSQLVSKEAECMKLKEENFRLNRLYLDQRILSTRLLGLFRCIKNNVFKKFLCRRQLKVLDTF